MFLILACSLLQPPAAKPADPPPAAGVTYSLDFVAPAKPDDLSAALAAHPDVQIAEAKLKIAQAELAKAKQAVAQQFAAARAKKEAAAADVRQAEQVLKRTTERAAGGLAPKEEVVEAEATLTAAKAALAVAEAEAQPPAPPVSFSWAVGTGPGQFVLNETYTLTDRLPTPPKPAPVADKLRELLDKPVRLPEQKAVPLSRALERLRAAAGTDLLFRSALPDHVEGLKPDDPNRNGYLITLPAGELPVRAWIDLIADAYRTHWQGTEFDVYVREYGMMLTFVNSAPPGAVRLGQPPRPPKPEPAAKKP